MTILEIQLEACKIWGKTIAEVVSKNRRSDIVPVRHCAMWVALNVFEYHPAEVERAFDSSHGIADYINKIHCREHYRLNDWIKCELLRTECESRLNQLTSLRKD